MTLSHRAVLTVIVAGFNLGGCYESTDVAIYEPHVYKGERDSERIMQMPPPLEEELSQRLQRGQTDR